MFKRKKKKTGIQTPELRKSTTPPPPPTSGSNAFKPSPVTIIPNNISTVEIMCNYETPCGWCTKWDKKCDKKVGRETPSIPMLDSHARKIINEIKSGKLPTIDMNDTYGLETRG